MGHLLSTVNKAAADAIDNPPSPPDVSTWVVFLPRPGVSRGFPFPRSEFPALVMGAHDDGSLALIVVMEAEDVILETRVPFQSHNQSAFCWRHRRAGPGEADLEPRIKDVEDFLRGEDALGPIVDAICQRIDTIESVLASDEMEALEKRIAALEGGKKPKGKPGRKPKGK